MLLSEAVSKPSSRARASRSILYTVPDIAPEPSGQTLVRAAVSLSAGRGRAETSPRKPASNGRRERAVPAGDACSREARRPRFRWARSARDFRRRLSSVSRAPILAIEIKPQVGRNLVIAAASGVEF